MNLGFLAPLTLRSGLQRRLTRLANAAGLEVSIQPGESVRYARHYVEPCLGVRGGWVVNTEQVTICDRWVLEGEMPAVAGWTLVARLDHTEGGVLVAQAPGVELDTRWRTAKPDCEHCRTKRARAETYVLRGPAGEVKQIGSTCLQEFLATSPAKLIALSELAGELLGLDYLDSEWGPGGRWVPSTLAFLTATVAAIRSQGGFQPSKAEHPTRGYANFLLGMPPKREQQPDLYREWHDNQPTPADAETAETVSAWAQALEASNDYEHNIKVAASCHAAKDARQGLLASIPVAYDRAMGRVRLAKQRAELPDAGHVGTVGKRETWTATLVSRVAIETDYGLKRLCTFRTSEGSDLFWACSGANCPYDADIGKVFSVKGTVKKHGEFRGRKQTVLLRVNAELIEERAELAAAC